MGDLEERFWRQETDDGLIAALVVLLVALAIVILGIVLFKSVFIPIFALVLVPISSGWLIWLMITHRQDIRLVGLVLLDLVLVWVLGAIWIYYGFIYVPPVS